MPSAVSNITNGINAASITTNAAVALGNLILATPNTVLGYQPQNGPISQMPQYTQPSLLFHYEGENTSTIESDITDHYIEDNSSIQDQIALKPVIITTQGFIGELNDVPPNKFFQAAQLVAQKLTVLGAYTPALSTTALIAYNEALFAYQTVQNAANAAQSAWSSVSGSGSSGTSVIGGNGVTNEPNQSKQQQYYQLLYGYWLNRTLFTVQTPWAIFTDMAIKSIRAIQAADTVMISDFEVTFKQIRFAKVLAAATLYSNPTNAQTRSVNQINSGSTQNGYNGGTNSVSSTNVALSKTGGL